MKSFTIENETNNITAHRTKREAAGVPNTESFSSAKELAALAASWPGARLIEIWNGIPGNTPVAKFNDRGTAVARIWKAIQILGETYDLADRASAPVSETIQVEEAEAPAGAPSTEPAQEPTALKEEVAEPVHEDSQPEVPAQETEANVGVQSPHVAPKKARATNTATRQKKTPTGEKAAKAPREESKTSQVIAMLKRKGGTTLDDIMTAMGWQKHTTRAMLSAGGSLTKKHGLVVTSEKIGDTRVYSIRS